MLVDSQPAVSFLVVGYSTNRWSNDPVRQEIRALVAVTNNSSQSLTYSGRADRRFPAYAVFCETPLGWKDTDAFLVGPGLERHTLSPGDGFIFEAIVEPDKRCKVVLTFDRAPSLIRQRLPSWLTRKLHWSSPSHTVTTDLIDLRGPRI
jgi:hypothetical protein